MNRNDRTGYGKVDYSYQIGVHEISRDMITKANAHVSGLGHDGGYVGH
ncbi:MAG: hypothetical protein R3F19_08310 [Verrucomicrobiales bacterium]